MQLDLMLMPEGWPPTIFQSSPLQNAYITLKVLSYLKIPDFIIPEKPTAIAYFFI